MSAITKTRASRKTSTKETPAAKPLRKRDDQYPDDLHYPCVVADGADRSMVADLTGTASSVLPFARKTRKKSADTSPESPQDRCIVADGIDRLDLDTHYSRVDPVTPIRKARKSRVLPVDGGGEGQMGLVLHAMDAITPVVIPPDPLIIKIVEMHRRRQLWIRSETALTNQCMAWCRRLVSTDEMTPDENLKEGRKLFSAVEKTTDHPLLREAMVAIMPLLAARASVRAERDSFEKEFAKVVKQLPIAQFAIDTKGISLVGLGTIIGEVGDLTRYANPGKVWKRMGLAPYHGKAYSSWRSENALTAEEWKAAGYRPSRRSVSWNVGSSLIGGMGKGKRPMVDEDISKRDDWSPFEKLFVERLRFEVAKDPSHARPATAEGKESFSRHAANRALRYVEKRFLKNLWRYARKLKQMPYRDEVYDTEEMAA